jgi:hypothetical protein
MQLDWRNRCVGGERLEDLFRTVQRIGARDPDELADQIWDDPDSASPLLRAMLRVAAELLWEQASTLRHPRLVWLEPFDRLSEAALREVLVRAGLELHDVEVAFSSACGDDANHTERRR